MKQSQAISAFAALADETRIGMLRHLVRCGSKGCPAGEIAAQAKASPSKASFHLNVLAQSGLITAQKVSRNVIYRVEFSALGGLVQYILEDCCANNDEVTACYPTTAAAKPSRNSWKI